jgi:hypothetical protein
MMSEPILVGIICLAILAPSIIRYLTSTPD